MTGCVHETGGIASGAKTDRERFDLWQNAALDAWERAGRRGIIEAVTGSGKTHVAYKAIKRLTKQFGPRLHPIVVVPTIPLMEQWRIGLEKVLDAPVGMQGDGQKDTFATFRNGKPVSAVVSTIHSAVSFLEDGLLNRCSRRGDRSLVIADECHHVLSQTATLYPRILDFPFDFKLGLSATVGRFQIERLGKIVYEYNLRTAVNEGVIPPFDIVNIGLSLTETEIGEYLRLENEAGETLAKVKSAYGLGGIWNESLWVELQRLARYDKDPLVLKLFALIFKKAELVYTAQQKIALAPDLIRTLVGDGRKVLVFFERIRSVQSVDSEASLRTMAMATARSLQGHQPVPCHVYHSGLTKPERKRVLGAFRLAGPSALLACRALNEGLDVPTVDAAVIVAATQNRRSMIQRIGRTLRQEAGKCRPLIAILHAKGTNDDHVRVGVDDQYFAGPARIFETDAIDCRSFIATLSQTGSPPSLWMCIYDSHRDCTDQLVPLLGEAADGPPVRIEMAHTQPMEDVIRGVLPKKGAFFFGQQRLRMGDVRRVFRKSMTTDM